MSTTEPTPAERQLNTKVGAKSLVMVSWSVAASTARTRSPTLSLVQPSWLTMKAGVLSSLITRWSE